MWLYFIISPLTGVLRGYNCRTYKCFFFSYLSVVKIKRFKYPADILLKAEVPKTQPIEENAQKN
jgi:hypothetical protein